MGLTVIYTFLELISCTNTCFDIYKFTINNQESDSMPEELLNKHFIYYTSGYLYSS